MKTIRNSAFRSIGKTVYLLIAIIICGGLLTFCNDDDPAPEANRPPKCMNIGDQSAKVGTLTNIEICAVDPDGDRCAINVTSDASFITVSNLGKTGDTTKVNLVIEPTELEPASYLITVEADDGKEGKDTRSFTLNITNSDPPVFESIGNITLTAGRTKTIPITATDPDGDDIVFELEDNPGFLLLTDFAQDGNTATANLVVFPDEIQEHVGEFNPVITATDSWKAISSAAPSINIIEPINVVTIYFCGTGMDASMGKDTSFNSELIATLHEFHSTDMNETHNFYKEIIAGVGAPQTDCNAGCEILNPYYPDSRNWEKIHTEAKAFYEDVESNSIGNIIVNLVGFSRGGISCMVMGKKINSNIYTRLKHKNIICIDPVPGLVAPAVGDAVDRKNTLANAYFTIGGDYDKTRSFVGIYSADERTNSFTPVVPFLQHHCAEESQNWLFTMPGSHETLVGNGQRDGRKCDHIHPPQNEEIEAFKNVGEVTRTIIIHLLKADLWGNNQFTNKMGTDSETKFKSMCSRIKSLKWDHHDRIFMREVVFWGKAQCGWNGFSGSLGHEWYGTDDFYWNHPARMIIWPIFHADQQVYKRACFVGPYLSSQRTEIGKKLHYAALEDRVSELPDNTWDKLQEFKKSAN